MIKLGEYCFADDKASIACSQVMNGAPVLLFVHDSDGDIQFMCGKAGHPQDVLKVIGLAHLSEHLRSITNLPMVQPGLVVERMHVGASWGPKFVD